MAYDYDSGTGGFDQLGVLAGRVKTVRTMQNDLKTQRGTIIAKYPAASAHRSLNAINKINELVLIATETQIEIAKAAAVTLIESVDDESALSRLAVPEGAEGIRLLMIADSETIKESAVGSSIAYDAGNTGTGKVIVGVTNPDSVAWQHSRAEDLTVKCVQDAQTGAITAGEEMFTLVGEKALSNLSNDWPAGSGISSRLRSAHGGFDQGTRPNQNRLKNSDMEDWTSSVPDDWTLEVGVAATDMDKSTNAVRGAASAEWTGDGATLTKISQDLDGTDGVRLKPRTVYAISLWVKAITAAPAAGVLQISLQNSGDTITQNDGSTNQSFTIDLTAITTSWVLYSSTFQTPSDVPSTAKLALELTTAITNTKVVETDDIVLQEMLQPHPGGPYFAIAAGATDWVLDDEATVTITNGWANDEWVRELDRLFDYYGLGLLVPTATSGAETIADALIL